jgi:hypothetical protein
VGSPKLACPDSSAAEAADAHGEGRSSAKEDEIGAAPEIPLAKSNRHHKECKNDA